MLAHLVHSCISVKLMIWECNPCCTAALLVSLKPFQSICLSWICAGIKIHLTVFWSLFIQISNKKPFKSSYPKATSRRDKEIEVEESKNEKRCNVIHKMILWHTIKETINKYRRFLRWTQVVKKLLTIQYFVFGRGIVFILFYESQKGKQKKMIIVVLMVFLNWYLKAFCQVYKI